MITSLSPSTLRQQVFKKRLKALKYGDIWMTTKEWLEEYLTSRKRKNKVAIG